MTIMGRNKVVRIDTSQVSEEATREMFVDCISYRSKKFFYDFEHMKKMFKVLKSLGIKKVICKDTKLQKKDLIFPEKTLVIYPIIEDVTIFPESSNLRETIRKEFYNTPGYNSRICSHNILMPFDREVTRLTYQGVLIGDFYYKRNMIILYYNIFTPYATSTYIYNFSEFLKKVLDESKVNQKQTMTKEDYEKMIARLQLKKFMKLLDVRLSNIQGEIARNEDTISKYSREIIASYGRIKMVKAEQIAINKLRLGFEKDFSEQIESIKELKFVKNVLLSSEGIEVDVGKIIIKNTYIGSMTILITPSNIKFLNEYSVGGYQHPHVHANEPCFGSYDKLVYKLLGILNLKRLVFVLYQFLNTYSEDNCYHSISKWRIARKEENKFDKEGELLKKKKNGK